MNYPSETGTRRPPRKSNLFLLLIMAGMAFWLFTQFQSVSARAKAAREQQRVQEPIGANPNWDDVPDISDIKVPDRVPIGGQVDPHSQPIDLNPYENKQADWSIDTDIPSTGQHEVTISSEGRQTKRGDWELEVGESQPGQQGAKSPPKSTRRGDWEVSEVETAPEPE